MRIRCLVRGPAIRSCLIVSILCFAAGAAGADGNQPLSVWGASISAHGPDMMEVGAGAFNILDIDDDTEGDPRPAAFIEVRSGRKLYYLGPMIGIVASDRSSAMIYGGVYADIHFGSYVATPSLSAGAYNKGAGPDLGGTFQFRSAITMAYEFRGGSRIGVRIAHVSNAGLHDRNPGENELLLIYGVPF